MSADNEKKNAKQHAQRYFAKHMVAGVAGYENEKILVTNETIERMNASFSGKPVYVNHQPVDLENLQQTADGYVVKSFYNEKDGWFWAEIMVVSDDGHDAVKRGWAVSNAYIPLESSGGGQNLGVDYNRKIENAEFTHLAIVSNPRYEESVILSPDDFKKYQDKRTQDLAELHNEKTKGTPMLKFFKAKKEEVTNASEFTADTLCPVGDSHVAYSTLVAAYELQNKKNSDDAADKDAEEAEKENEDAADDIEVKKEELAAKKNKKAKKNESDIEEDMENEDDKECEKEKTNEKPITQADVEAAVKAALTAQATAKSNFDELSNANKKQSVAIDLSFDKLARGKERY